MPLIFFKNAPRIWYIFYIAATSLPILLAAARIFGSEVEIMPNTGSQKRVILVGASIGRGWNIEKLPERVSGLEFVFEYVGSGSFDKSSQLAEIWRRPKNRPDAVILKECAAYFPNNLDLYKQQMKSWAEQCRAKGVLPILATVVPVTRLHAVKKFLIDIVKLRNPFKSGGPFRERRLKAILEYNDWIKAYSREQGWPLLDLEAALRYSETNRRLQSRWAQYDGLHLNPRAYRILDGALVALFNKISWEPRQNGSSGIREPKP